MIPFSSYVYVHTCTHLGVHGYLVCTGTHIYLQEVITGLYLYISLKSILFTPSPDPLDLANSFGKAGTPRVMKAWF